MARQSVIVGIGEALLRESPQGVEPAGLAVNCALHAMRLGHRGVPVSRLGQDPQADQLLELLREKQVMFDHLQSDPDLPTGRLVIRTVGGKSTRSLTPRAAFDNLQWDFDLVDVAQQADAVIFGALARREGQSRSIIKRFLAECTAAVRVFDLTNRALDSIDRSEARSGLEFAEGVIVDSPALKALLPGATGDLKSAALEILRGSSLAFVATIEPGECSETWSIHSETQSARAAHSTPAAHHDATMLGLLHGVLSGWDFARCIQAASRSAQHAAQPDQPLNLNDA